MNEFKREIEIVKKECARDPGARASWIGIGLLLGLCVFLGLLMLPFLL